MANNSAGQHTQSIKDFGLAALEPINGVLLGIGPAKLCSLACALVARASYTTLREKVAVCAPTHNAMLVQAMMWYDAKMKDEEWVIFEEGEFWFWAIRENDLSLEDHTYSYKLKRFAQEWSKDQSHTQHENAKVYLAEMLKRQQLFEEEDADPKILDPSKEQNPSPEQKALEGHFWSQINVVFCTNIGAGHELLKTKFEAQVVVMDQAGLATMPECMVPLVSWRESVDRVIMAGDIRQPNPDRPIKHDYGRNESIGALEKSLLEQHAGTPERFYQDSNYTVVVLHDE